MKQILLTNDDGIRTPGLIILSPEACLDETCEEGTDLEAVTNGYISIGTVRNVGRWGRGNPAHLPDGPDSPVLAGPLELVNK